MSTCLSVIQAVVVPVSSSVTSIGDVFLTEEAIYIVPYGEFAMEVPSRRGDSTKYTLAGALAGGVAGVVVGSVIDAALDSGKQQKREQVLWSRERACKEADKASDHDYGMSPQERATSRDGLRLTRDEVSRVSCDRCACLIEFPDQSTLAMFLSTERIGQVLDVLRSWKDSRLEKASDDSLQGTNVGVGIMPFLDSFRSGTPMHVTADAVERMAADPVYISRLADKLERVRGEQRKAVVQWFHEIGEPLRLKVARSLEQRVRKTRLTYGILAAIIAGWVSPFAIFGCRSGDITMWACAGGSLALYGGMWLAGVLPKRGGGRTLRDLVQTE